MTDGIFISQEVAEQLLQIADRISQHPTSFDMAWWENTEEECGTMHCIGGHLCILNGLYPDQGNATDLLLAGSHGLWGHFDVHSLYFLSSWPEEWQVAYHIWPDHAEVAADYIRWWVAKHRPESAGG